MIPTNQISPHPASLAQAAAIAAAIEQFMRATASSPIAGGERPDPLVRAAILEGVTRAMAPPASSSEEFPDPWIRAAILEGVTRDPEPTFPAPG
jgi:hypothetical protein